MKHPPSTHKENSHYLITTHGANDIYTTFSGWNRKWLKEGEWEQNGSRGKGHREREREIE